MQTYAKLRHARISPQKCRLVADVVARQAVARRSDAEIHAEEGCRSVAQVLESAIANAAHHNATSTS